MIEPPTAAPGHSLGPADRADLADLADVRLAALATSRSILSAQMRAERELQLARETLQHQNAALAQANTMLAATMDATPVGVIAADGGGRVTLRNRRFDALFGLPAPAAGTQQLDDVMQHLQTHLRDPGALLRWLSRVELQADRAEPLRCETVDRRQLECQAIAQHVNGQRAGTVYNWLDITAHVEADALRTEADAAQRANLAKSAFVSRASHELRTPLNAVLGFAQLLAVHEAVSRDVQADTYVRHILKAGEHLLALLEDLLQLSGLEAGMVTIRPERVDMALLLAEAVQLTAPQAQQLRLRVSSRVETPAWAMVDATRMRQVLINLLSNAIKYNRPEGVVGVSFERGVAFHRVTVSDNGHGMTADQLAHLFEPFNRLGAERSRVGGAGLGLALTRQLVERMHGSIDVQSSPGAGSVFTVHLPAADTA